MVQRIINSFNGTVTNPFNCENAVDLINIVTGKKDPSTEIVLAHSKGLEAIETAKQSKSSKIEGPKLTTFCKRVGNKKVPKEISVYKTEVTVTRVLCFLQESNAQEKHEAYSHEWTDYPSSLFEESTKSEARFVMRKGNKSDFLSYLQSDIISITEVQLLPPDSKLQTAYYVDAMAFLQRFQNMGKVICGELPKCYLQKLLQMKPKDCNQIHFIGDRYDFNNDISLKNDERQRRTTSNVGPAYEISRGMKIPIWKNFMENPNNKARLLAFISNEWCEHSDWIPDGVSVFLGGTFEASGKAVCIGNKTVIVIPQLSCDDHEEADTRIFAHIGYGVNMFHSERAIVCANDTDIIILSMFYYNKFDIKEMWIEKKGTFLPVHTMVEALCVSTGVSQDELVNTILCTYIISGNDHLSYPFRRGKKRAAKTAISLLGKINAFANFGDAGYTFESNVKNSARLFFIHLYGRGDEFCSLDTLREHLFASSKSDLRSLPPTEDAFHFHFLRALYDILLYKRAHLCNLNLPPQTNFGRELIDGELMPIKMSKPAMPQTVKRKYCNCQSGCQNRCSCEKKNIPCTGGYTCTGSPNLCKRYPSESNTSTDSSESDSD